MGLDEARALADAGRFDEATTVCADLDESGERWLLEGTIAARQDAEDVAQTRFERAAKAGTAAVARDATLALASRAARRGQRMTALEFAKAALAMSPEDPVARHLKVTLGNQGADTPLHGEVAGLFDDYAEFYDIHIVDTLGYRGPQLVAAALAAHAVGEDPMLILDLGCGTGLCGPPARPFANALVGIDLSREMVLKCREVLDYDAVWQDDAVHALRTFGDGHVGAILAGDVVGYIRDVERAAQYAKTGPDNVAIGTTVRRPVFACWWPARRRPRSGHSEVAKPAVSRWPPTVTVFGELTVGQRCGRPQRSPRQRPV